MKIVTSVATVLLSLGSLSSAVTSTAAANAEDSLIQDCVKNVAEVCHLDTHRHIMRYACIKQIGIGEKSEDMAGHLEEWYRLLATGCHGHVM